MAERTYRVYVGNLGNSGVRGELEKEFGKFGTIQDVWVARNPPGFAFIEFYDRRDAEDAVYRLNGKRVCGVTVRVEMSKGGGGSSSNSRSRSSRSEPSRYRDEPLFDRYGSSGRSTGRTSDRLDRDRDFRGSGRYDDRESRFERPERFERPDRFERLDTMDDRYRSPVGRR